MIKDLLKLTPDALREIQGALPSKERSDFAVNCLFMLLGLGAGRGLNSRLAHQEIIKIADDLLKGYSPAALALALAYAAAGNDIMLADHRNENLAAVTAGEAKRLMLEVDDFEAALRVLKSSRNPKARQAAREAAAGVRLAGLRPRQLPL
jgi:hypothetical protein